MWETAKVWVQLEGNVQLFQIFKTLYYDQVVSNGIFNCLCIYYIHYLICADQNPSVKSLVFPMVKDDKWILQGTTLGKQDMVKDNIP